MTINKKKSGIMLHRGKLKATSTCNGTQVHNISQIPIVDTYKYLGILIDKHLNFQAHLNYIKDKIKKP